MDKHFNENKQHTLAAIAKISGNGLHTGIMAEMILNPVDMVFNYAEAYNGEEPEAYETLLEDVITGNATLFMRADQVEAAWKVITPILETWQKRPPEQGLHNISGRRLPAARPGRRLGARSA